MDKTQIDSSIGDDGHEYITVTYLDRDTLDMDLALEAGTELPIGQVVGVDTKGYITISTPKPPIGTTQDQLDWGDWSDTDAECTYHWTDLRDYFVPILSTGFFRDKQDT
jgi:hypothetical protein